MDRSVSVPVSPVTLEPSGPVEGEIKKSRSGVDLKTGTQRSIAHTGWRGPFLVVSKHHGAYRLQHPRHTVPYPGLYAADHLRMYHPRPERLRPVDSVPVVAEDLTPKKIGRAHA